MNLSCRCSHEWRCEWMLGWRGVRLANTTPSWSSNLYWILTTPILVYRYEYLRRMLWNAVFNGWIADTALIPARVWDIYEGCTIAGRFLHRTQIQACNAKGIYSFTRLWKSIGLCSSLSYSIQRLVCLNNIRTYYIVYIINYAPCTHMLSTDVYISRLWGSVRFARRPYVSTKARMCILNKNGRNASTCSNGLKPLSCCEFAT